MRSASPRPSERISLIRKLSGRNRTKLTEDRLCQLFGVAKSSYYRALKPKPINKQEMELRVLVRQVFNDSKQSAGSRTIAHVITNQHGIRLSRYKATRLMKDIGLISKQIKHRYKQREDKHSVYDNVLDRKFSPTAPNQVWTGDVTFIRIKGGWCYLAVVIDLYSRNIVGFSMSDSPDSKLTSKALRMAYESRLKPDGVLFHSDQGTHYTSKEFANSLASCKDMTHSMSRKGNPLQA